MKEPARIDQTFAALADPTRRAVIRLLRRRPYRAGELASALQLAPAALSRHLRVLRKSGLIADIGDDSDARVRSYCLQPEALAPLRKWLDDVQVQWQIQLQSFKQYAEGKRRP
ncbi:MAG: winged helix-turn-helix transcriptional regulator [Betaproteobacteria bacterium]|nr:winged helix-turn-helix transcriptional regulator [Betaproteobacteria bacterium]